MSDIFSILAKSKKDGGMVTLYDHTIFMVNLVNYVYVNNLITFKRKDEYRDLIVSVILHDVGKCVCDWQKMINGKKQSKLQQHNVLSYAFAKKFLKINPARKRNICRIVLNHHAIDPVLIEKVGIDKYIEELETTCLDFIKFTCDAVCTYKDLEGLFDEYFTLDTNADEYPSVREITSLKLYGDLTPDFCKKSPTGMVEDNASYLLALTLMIGADRYASYVEREDYVMSKRVVEGDVDAIKELLDKVIYSDSLLEYSHEFCREKLLNDESFLSDKRRLLGQFELVEQCGSLKKTTCILNASTGFGKSIMSVLYALLIRKKAILVEPRNELCKEVYSSISEYVDRINYDCGTSITVNLLLSGEFEDKNLGWNADIVVTNIDNFLSPFTKAGESLQLIGLLFKTVIFDEWHESFVAEPRMAMFMDLMAVRLKINNSKTILMSGSDQPIVDSPSKYNTNYFFDEGDVEIISPYPYNGDKIIDVAIKEYESTDDIQINEKDAIIFVKNRRDAQEIYKALDVQDNEKTLVHAAFEEKDLIRKKEEMFNHHGKKSVIENRNILVTTQVCSCGCDISTSAVYDIFGSMQDFLQLGLGKLMRFNESSYDGELKYTIIILKGGGHISACLPSKTQKYAASTDPYGMACALRKKSIEFIKLYCLGKHTRKELYDLYHKFIDEYRKDIMLYLKDLYINSCKYRAELLFLKKSYKKIENDDDCVVLSSGMTIRGEQNQCYITTDEMDGSTTYDIDRLSNMIEKKGDKINALLYDNFVLHNGDKKDMKAKTKYAGVRELDYLTKFAKRQENAINVSKYFSYDSEYGLREK